MATPKYPQRPPFFAYRYCRLLTKTCAAQEIGHVAFVLCVTIAHQEDAKRYKGPVTFWNHQLLPIVGVKKWDTLDVARKRAVEAGWLHYESGGKHRVGKYWVTIPSQLANMDDSACDESLSPENGEEDPSLSPNNGDEGQSRYPRNGYNHGYNHGYKTGEHSTLALSLSLEEESAKADAPGITVEELVDQWNQIEGVVKCKAITEKRRTAFRARMKNQLWREHLPAALAAARVSNFLHGDNERGWRADFDFLLQPDSVTKLVEGKYDSRKPKDTSHRNDDVPFLT